MFILFIFFYLLFGNFSDFLPIDDFIKESAHCIVSYLNSCNRINFSVVLLLFVFKMNLELKFDISFFFVFLNKHFKAIVAYFFCFIFFSFHNLPTVC